MLKLLFKTRYSHIKIAYKIVQNISALPLKIHEFKNKNTEYAMLNWRSLMINLYFLLQVYKHANNSCTTLKKKSFLWTDHGDKDTKVHILKIWIWISP